MRSVTMSMLVLIFFISLLTPKLLAEGNSKLTSQQLGEPHCKNYDELLSIGPCQKNLIFCQNGMPLHLDCPEPLIFNPSSKFCEKPEDFLKAATAPSTNTNYLPILPPNNILMPFVGQMEPEIEHSYYSVPVLMPPAPNDIRPPYVGKLEPETDDNSYYPVLMPSNDIQPPFIRRMQQEIDDDESSYQPPFVGKMEQSEIDDDSSYQPPFIGRIEQPEIDDDSSYRPPFVGWMEQQEIDDSSYRQPFIGRMEPAADDTSYSVLLMPPNDIRPTYVGKLEPETGDNSYYPVLVPSNDIQPPFAGRMEQSEINEDSSYQPPFIGRMEPAADGTSYSVLLMPPNEIQSPFIGKMEPEMDDDDDPSYSVSSAMDEHIYAASMDKYQPEPEGHESREPMGGSEQIHATLMHEFQPEPAKPQKTMDDSEHIHAASMDKYQPGSEGHESREPMGGSEQIHAILMNEYQPEPAKPQKNMDDSEHIHAASMDKYQPVSVVNESRESMNVSDQIHATLVHKYQPEPAKPQDTADNSEPIYDTFMVKHQQSEESESQKPLVDHFKSSADSHSSKISPFAAFDHPADSGHDSFKPKIHPQIVHSKFAPMSTPVQLGHDMFKTRRKRSAGIDGNNMNVCLQLYANQLANRAITGYSSMNQSSPQCVAHQIPNGCRQFYIACLDGRRIKRHCPIGLYFDPRMQICKERGQIAACLVHPTPKALLQSAFLQQQQKPTIQTSYEQPQKPTTQTPYEQPQKPTNQTPYEHPRQQIPTSQAPYEQPKATNEKDQPKTINAYGTSINTSSATVYSTAPTKNASTITPSPIPRRLQQKKGMIKQKPQMPVLYPYGDFPEKFCSELPNGFYRHPKNCSRIVQCFGHELFEYPSCQHDLAFNQLTGVCDYPANVPGCSQLEGSDQFDFAISETEIGLQNDIDDEQQEIASSSTTNSTFHHQSTPSSLDSIGACAGGHSHGDHIEHPDHCSAFLRCVWGKLVPMSCPKGTAFNPMLSVCDYPNRVPNCQIK